MLKALPQPTLTPKSNATLGPTTTSFIDRWHYSVGTVVPGPILLLSRHEKSQSAAQPGMTPPEHKPNKKQKLASSAQSFGGTGKANALSCQTKQGEQIWLTIRKNWTSMCSGIIPDELTVLRKGNDKAGRIAKFQSLIMQCFGSGGSRWDEVGDLIRAKVSEWKTVDLLYHDGESVKSMQDCYARINLVRLEADNDKEYGVDGEEKESQESDG
ncbi:hypothetical protein K461DRAFT_145901 [Myriangium duriaei CBS 260.36]|uniref:Uncharacterized protein n=1 Tax=Myriangium duriaei CBS 260.36 TaxID=1168546 RepID=A0A9P4IYT1_9PEZI|nr:hypothetical protein K461DRAFT_145901 [Myriangium duriaei CBS 260.36]